MRKIYLATAAAAAFAFSQPAAADTVSDWWDLASRIANAAQSAGGLAGTPDQQRAVTRTALAMFEARERDRPALRILSRLSRRRRDRPRRTPPRRRPPIRSCSTIIPPRSAAIEESYAIAMAGIPDEPRARGRAADRRGGGGGGDRRRAGSIPPSRRSPTARAPRPASGSAPSLPPIEPYMSAFRPWAIPSARGAAAAAAAGAHQPGLGARL